jgi:hypothetical protein
VSPRDYFGHPVSPGGLANLLARPGDYRGYLAEAARPCRQARALVVADEVQSGMARTGKWFAYQCWPEVDPALGEPFARLSPSGESILRLPTLRASLGGAGENVTARLGGRPGW